MVCVCVLGGWGERAGKRGKEGKERERKRIESRAKTENSCGDVQKMDHFYH